MVLKFNSKVCETNKIFQRVWKVEKFKDLDTDDLQEIQEQKLGLAVLPSVVTQCKKCFQF